VNSETDIALIKKDIKYLKDGVDDIKNKMNCMGTNYVSKIEFDLTNKDHDKRVSQIEKLVYSAIGLAVITLGKALLDLVVVARASQ